MVFGCCIGLNRTERPIRKEVAGVIIFVADFHLEIARLRYFETSNNIKPKLNYYA